MPQSVSALGERQAEFLPRHQSLRTTPERENSLFVFLKEEHKQSSNQPPEMPLLLFHSNWTFRRKKH